MAEELAQYKILNKKIKNVPTARRETMKLITQNIKRAYIEHINRITLGYTI